MSSLSSPSALPKVLRVLHFLQHVLLRPIFIVSHKSVLSICNLYNFFTLQCYLYEWKDVLAFFLREPALVVFSGGMAYGNNRRGITLMRGRSKNLLLTDVVVDFQCLVASPYPTGMCINRDAEVYCELILICCYVIY